MQIVIDVSDEQYEIIKKIVKNQNSVCPDVDSAEKIILNGTPLPKGHSNLIDANKAFVLLNEQIDKHDKMMAKYEPYSNNQIPLWWWKGICKKSTIIEADKESEVNNG